MWPSAERLARAGRAGCPTPSSIDLEAHRAVLDRDAHAHLARRRACLAALRSSSRASDITSSSRRPAAAGSISTSHAIARGRRLLGADRPQRGLQAADLQLHRVQVEHHLADLPDRAAEPVAHARQVRVVALAGRAQARDVVPEREQVLQRAVVQRLGDAAARAVLGVERQRDEPRRAPPSSAATSASRLAAARRRRRSRSRPPP